LKCPKESASYEQTICYLQHSKSDELVRKFDDIFKTEISDFNYCNVGSHTIRLSDQNPVTEQNHRFPVHQESDIQKEISKLLRLGIIVESNSPLRSKIVPIPKPDGSTRLRIDYRPLNCNTIKDSYQVPGIDEIIDALSNAKYFTILDATSGHYQIPLDKQDREKTAFSWKGGHYKFIRMPFGLCNAPATFQRTMDKVFKRESYKSVIPYLDDIIIFSNNAAEHEKPVETALGKIRAAV
ncbi:putative LTR transposable element, partial [Pseudoloma neurophilia]